MDCSKVILPDINEIILKSKGIHPKLSQILDSVRSSSPRRGEISLVKDQPTSSPVETSSNKWNENMHPLSMSVPTYLNDKAFSLSPRTEYVMVYLTININKVSKTYFLTSSVYIPGQELEALRKELEVYNNHADALFNGLACYHCYDNGYKRKKNINLKFNIAEDNGLKSDLFNTKNRNGVVNGQDVIRKKTEAEFMKEINMSDKKLISFINDRWDGSLQNISLGYDLLPTFTKYVIMDTVKILKDHKKIKDDVVKYCQDMTGIIL
ncbi:Hypothetical protein ORPV_170 [Orpheovirus IHUMI-LCC2]|uniref:Uncharacterized protein n=1 Tax=Orpheovirus IHUMI-LCC2 TaxID=2023057 RepID=A0A2I2L3G7_9VIRU|nr:Hypothetical protein ORPV_170 [Orpheovirus IHUMI-LCC2]SNW62074.1 Hypothetical protein ORPV_170 [Orpheovirus IHUMI-LCC2]